MHNGAFQLNKVRRMLRTQGISVVVKKPVLNDFGEPIGDTKDHEIKGVFHETTSYASKTTTEASTIRKKSSPMLLCLWEDIAEILHHQDEVAFNNKTYKVNEIKNVAEANLVADISLEEVQT